MSFFGLREISAFYDLFLILISIFDFLALSVFFVFREIHVFFDFLLRLVFLFNCLGISAFFLPAFIVIIVDFSTFLGLIFFDLLVLEIKVFLFAVLRFVFFFSISLRLVVSHISILMLAVVPTYNIKHQRGISGSMQIGNLVARY